MSKRVIWPIQKRQYIIFFGGENKKIPNLREKCIPDLGKFLKVAVSFAKII